jgi:hypothetical protein
MEGFRGSGKKKYHSLKMNIPPDVSRHVVAPFLEDGDLCALLRSNSYHKNLLQDILNNRKWYVPRITPGWEKAKRWRNVQDIKVFQRVDLRVEHVVFHHMFNKPLDMVIFPVGLVLLNLGAWFDHPLDQVTFPDGLKSLQLSDEFNHPLEQVSFPNSLKSLHLGVEFDHSLEQVSFPNSLKSLHLGVEFDHSLDQVTFPSGLVKLCLGENFNHSLDHVTFPPSLLKLDLGLMFNHPLEHVSFPSSLKCLVFSGSFDQSLENTCFPSGLNTLEFLEDPVEQLIFSPYLERGECPLESTCDRLYSWLQKWGFKEVNRHRTRFDEYRVFTK